MWYCCNRPLSASVPILRPLAELADEPEIMEFMTFEIWLELELLEFIPIVTLEVLEPEDVSKEVLEVSKVVPKEGFFARRFQMT